MKTVALIANGRIDSIEALRPSILKHQRIVAVDGGLQYCREMGVAPHLIIGDFDSCPKELLDHYGAVPQIILPVDKDQTDLEVAIEHELQKGAEQIVLFASWGNRIDHSLTNALFLTRYPGKLLLETETEQLFAINKRTELKCRVGQTLSLIPICGPVSGITTSGLKWELKHRQIDSRFIGISNICLKEIITISIDQGTLLCCLLKQSS